MSIILITSPTLWGHEAFYTHSMSGSVSAHMENWKILPFIVFYFPPCHTVAGLLQRQTKKRTVLLWLIKCDYDLIQLRHSIRKNIIINELSILIIILQRNDKTITTINFYELYLILILQPSAAGDNYICEDSDAMSLVLLSSPCFLLKALKYLMSIDLIAHKSLHT